MTTPPGRPTTASAASASDPQRDQETAPRQRQHAAAPGTVGADTDDGRGGATEQRLALEGLRSRAGRRALGRAVTRRRRGPVRAGGVRRAGGRGARGRRAGAALRGERRGRHRHPPRRRQRAGGRAAPAGRPGAGAGGARARRPRGGPAACWCSPPRARGRTPSPTCTAPAPAGPRGRCPWAWGRRGRASPATAGATAPSPTTSRTAPRRGRGPGGAAGWPWWTTSPARSSAATRCAPGPSSSPGWRWRTAPPAPSPTSGSWTRGRPPPEGARRGRPPRAGSSPCTRRPAPCSPPCRSRASRGTWSWRRRPGGAAGACTPWRPRPGRGTRTRAAATGRLLALDPATLAVEREWPLSPLPAALAVAPDGGHAYALTGSLLTHLDLGTGAQRLLALLPRGAGGLAVTDARVYATDLAGREVWAVDRHGGHLVQTIPVGRHPAHLALGSAG